MKRHALRWMVVVLAGAALAAGCRDDGTDNDGQDQMDKAKDKLRAERTRRTQGLLLQAIRAHYEYANSWPAQEPETWGDEDGARETGRNLLVALRANDAAKQVLHKLSNEALPADGDAVLDAYGNPMGYRQTGALGGGPLIVSAGPDGRFDTEEDNIRSDVPQ